jgi:PKD repeat protein
MKKIFFLLVVLLFASFWLNAQTMTVHLSGTVLRDSTYAPVPIHEVLIQADSNASGFTYYNSRFTNANGFYDCTINNVPTTGTAVSFIVKTKNCDSTWMYQTFVGTITPDTVNFLICNGNNAGCEAGFHAVVDSSDYYLVHFYDYSTPHNDIVSWNWDFGDGMTSNNPNPVHVYPAAGTYTVCLTIVTGNNCSSTVCHDVTVGQNTQCQAHYSYYADSVNVLHIHFWDTSTPLNMVTSRLWNFGDPASGINNTATTMDPWHVYSQAGFYSVCLTINTSNGCTSTFCDTISVGSSTSNCENWMTYTHSGFTYTFEGHTHSIFPTTYNWNFGDGSAGVTGHNVTHTYATPGTYTVTLNSVDSVGCEWNRTESVIVSTTTFDLYGYVYLSNQLYVDHGLAELIRVDSGFVTTIDSVIFGDSLGMYHFGGVLPGHYYVRATLLPTSVYYGQYVPTYYHDAINWANATLIELGQPVNPYNIYMHHVNGYDSGSGNIHGTINQNGKYSDSGTPAADVEVLLMDESNQVLAFTSTNTSGEFSFENMALGTYKVYPEMIEKSTTPTTVILDETHTGVNVVFTIEGSNISGIHDITTQTEFSVSDVYPNPVSENANLNIQTLHSTGITVSVYSITGEFVKDMNCNLHSGTNKIVIPVAELRKGLYYVKVEKPQGGVVVKKFISGR